MLFRSLQPRKMGSRMRAGGAVEGFGIPMRQGGLQDSRASVPSRRATGTSCPPPGESEEVTLPEKDGSCRPFIWASGCGRARREQNRYSHASVPSRRASGFSSLRSLKDGHRNQVPPQGESEGVMLPEKQGSCSPLTGSGLRAGNAVEGFGILMPPFP